ncbi:Hypothetical protein HDN1F_25060 [gamma proteobacterium HdN1]|nr:Hypothetical protein HDN1F_25060 [gamma proteobacterium HdN1]
MRKIAIITKLTEMPMLRETPPTDLEAVIDNRSSEAALNRGRTEQWQRKLLDLTLRNPLLNMRSSKTNIPLIAPNVGLLEDLLSEGKALSIEAAPLRPINPDNELDTPPIQPELDEQIALTALQRGKIFAPIEPTALESALLELYRKARNDLEEGGANTLFLAIGILHWQRPDSREKTCRAPLILIPVNITRQSVRSGIKLTLSDDEPRFNTTLLEMLRQDFGLTIQGLDGPLPTDESGTAIAQVLDQIRSEVRDIAGFEVRNDTILGTFSFAKYLMWKDLVDRTHQLKESPVVRHLVETPRLPFQQSGEFIPPEQLDKRIPPAQLFTPLSSDSSQLAAVVGAAEGKNFVMIGPPGTGKSQTIANMIAHNLGLGRTVLFVAEKAAALNVVYRRLREQGLGEFCLELHSNKARKLDVLRQLGEAWNVHTNLSTAGWARDTTRLQQLREELNQLVQALHETHRNGMSIRSALATVVSADSTPTVALSWENPDQHDPADYEHLLAIGERIDLNATEIGSVSSHPLEILHTSDWSMAWQQTLLRQAAELTAHATAWQEQIRMLAQRLQITGELNSSRRQQALALLALALLQAAGKDLSFAFTPTTAESLQAIAQLKTHLAGFADAQNTLSCPYDRDKALQADLRIPQALWSKSSQTWWLPRLFLAWNCRRFLQKKAGATGKTDPAKDLQHLAQMQSQHEAVKALAPKLETVPGWRNLDSDIPLMNAHGEAATALRTATAALAQDADELIALRAEVRKLVLDANEMLAEGAVLGTQLARCLDAHKAFHAALNPFAESAQRTSTEILELPKGLEDIVVIENRLIGAQPKINAWCAWRRVRAEAVTLGLQSIIQAIEKGDILPSGARQAIQTNYARWWVTQKFDASPVLRNFVSVEHERKIEHFRDLDARLRKITTAAIRARIRENITNKEDAKRSSGFGIIRRELEKKARHKPLRQLISETGNAIPTLTPCLLMSPLSIAQYLPVDQEAFDLVIFDEASQITVWDAIGALARGKQAIVVGDPKQLPPTSFFASGQSENAEPEEEEDLESILDEMLGANFPTLPLSWHYRSRSESLITFSNHRYYKGGLITFPSPATQDTAVNFAFVGGVYDRGSTQTNRDEANAIVAEIEKRLTDPATSSQTLGVVTFNQKQQTLIQTLLEAARQKNPELDPHFAEDKLESVFVKNLESVQGDERDVILFSTTFGPDSAGNITMNFGPLNKSGGERRLNVAITRARCELKVFCSVRAEQIDLSRTSAIGVRDLKHFLEFAERGPRALGETTSSSTGEFDSPFEATVSAALQEKGWTLHPQIGVSRFRVDLGVVDPDTPGRYLAGIECDGKTYRRSATARDRDLIRESVLRGLGWEILRLWSTDYWLDPEGSIDKLDQHLKRLLTQRRATRSEHTTMA